MPLCVWPAFTCCLWYFICLWPAHKIHAAYCQAPTVWLCILLCFMFYFGFLTSLSFQVSPCVSTPPVDYWLRPNVCNLCLIVFLHSLVYVVCTPFATSACVFAERSSVPLQVLIVYVQVCFRLLCLVWIALLFLSSCLTYLSTLPSSLELLLIGLTTCY